MNAFDPLLADPEWRLRRFPAKALLSAFNRKHQQAGVAVVGVQRIADEISRTDLDTEFVDALSAIEAAL